MCKGDMKYEAKSQIERLIEALDRLSGAMERSQIGGLANMGLSLNSVYAALAAQQNHFSPPLQTPKEDP